MAVKKRRTATAKVKEATPTYTARSPRVARKRAKPAPRPRAKKASPGEALWDVFLGLTDDEQSAFVRRMFTDPHWREDIIDGLSIIEASKEPSIPLEDYIAAYEARAKNNRAK